jgi:hypothetical protein
LIKSLDVHWTVFPCFDLPFAKDKNQMGVDDKNPNQALKLSFSVD